MRATLAVDASVAWSRHRTPTPPPAAIPFVLIGGMFAAVDTTNDYHALGYNEGESDTHDACATLFHDDQTLTSWTVKLNTALAAGQTLTAAISVNGVDDATMPIAMVQGDTGGVANGSLSIPAGATVSVHYTFGGGLVVKFVRGCVFAFMGSPFVVESARAQLAIAGIAVQGCANQVVDGGDFTGVGVFSPTVAGSLHPLPAAVSVTGISIHTESSVVPPASWDFIIGMAGPVAATTIIPTVTQDGTGDFSGSPIAWPPNTGPSDCNAGMAYHQPPNATYANVRAQLATRYAPAAPYDGYSLILSSLNAGLFVGGESPNVALAGDSDDTSFGVELLWPSLPGTFKYLLGYSKMSNADDPVQVDTMLVVDSVVAITASSASVQANPVYGRNDVTTKHVSGGELVQIRYTITTGGTADIRLGAAVGFLPD